MGDTNYAGKSLIFTVIATIVTIYFIDYNFIGLLVFPLSLLVTLITSIIRLRSTVATCLIIFFAYCLLSSPIFEMNDMALIIVVSIVVGVINKYIS